MKTPTERLYYTDPDLTSFEAAVTDCRERNGRHVVVLDRTAFYPTSGGQPHDVGTLAAGIATVNVIEVEDDEEGEILHATDGPISPGTVIHGTVDAVRRFDHRQQHTGQHVLSAAFDRLFGARTVGFHLGAEVSTLDLDAALPPDAIARAESEANRIVWENRPVTIRFVSPEEAANLPLRKEPVKAGPLRLIGVEGYDLSACGGTHVRATGAIGIIAVRSWEKLRGGTRLTFVCGGRALDAFRLLRDAVARSLTRLSVAPEELPEAIGRVQDENKALQRTLRAFQEKLAGYEAVAMVARGEREGAVLLIVEAVEALDQNGLKTLAAAAASTSGVVAALFTDEEPAHVAIARARNVDLDASAALKALLAMYGGKGGGRPDLAQGGGVRASRTHLKTALREIIREALRPST